MEREAIVLGGGIIGTLTGVLLRRAGWSVTLLEASHVGAGSSSRSAAGIRQQFSTEETVRGMRYSVAFYLDWRERIGGERPPIRQVGYLFLVRGAERWEAARRLVLQQRTWGLREVEALGPVALAERFPWVAAEAVDGGTWCPTDGFLYPDVIYQDAAEALRRLGGRIVQRAPVESAVQAGGRLQEVGTPRGRFGADLFVDCTNAWTRRTARVLGATELPVAALKRYLWFLARGDAWSAEAFAALPLVIAPGGAYCRPENPDSLMMGRAHPTRDESETFSHDDQDRVEPAFFHASGPDAVPYEVWMELAEVIPALAEFAGLTATTAGYYGTTPDHNPFLCYDPAVSNLIRLVGFSGHGAMFGPFAATVGLALAEAGRPLTEVEADGQRLSIAAFAADRDFRHAEAMVI